MKKQTLVDRILAIIQGGDKKKLSKFEEKLGKYFTKQISMREDQIKGLKEKIEEADEALQESVLSVDVEKIATGEDAENYCPTYVANLNSKLEKVEDFEEQIAELEKEIARFKKLETAVYTADEK